MSKFTKIWVAIAALLIPVAQAHAVGLSWGWNYTTPTQWSGSSWSTAGAGTALDPIFYSGTPLLTDTFQTAGCPEIGNWFFGTPNPGFSWYTGAGGTTIGPKVTFTGSIAGGVLTVTSPTGGTIYPSQTVNYLNGATPTQDYITSQLTGTTGGAGTYQLAGSETISSQSMTSQAVSYTPIHNPTAPQTDPLTCSSSNHLQIATFFSATAGGTGKPGWVVGSIGSSDYSYAGGDGQAFTYGYFEASITLPASPVSSLSPWDAYWMAGRLTVPGHQVQYQEYDLFETFQLHTNFQTTIHRWTETPPIPSGYITSSQQNVTTTATDLFDGSPHTYGILRTPNQECSYRDRALVECFPIYGNDMRGLMQMLVNTAINAPVSDPAQTSVMQINYMTAYACPAARPLCQ